MLYNKIPGCIAPSACWIPQCVPHPSVSINGGQPWCLCRPGSPNTTSPLCACAARQMLPCLRKHYGNITTNGLCRWANKAFAILPLKLPFFFKPHSITFTQLHLTPGLMLKISYIQPKICYIPLQFVWSFFYYYYSKVESTCTGPFRVFKIPTK